MYTKQFELLTHTIIIQVIAWLKENADADADVIEEVY